MMTVHSERRFVGVSLGVFVTIAGIAFAQEPTTLATTDERITELTFSPDGTTLAAVGHGKLGMDNWVRTYDIESNKMTKELKGKVLSASYRCDGKMIVAGGYDGQLTFWNLPKEARVDSQPPFGADVVAVAQSPVGFVCASGGDARFIMLIDPKLGTKRLYGHTAAVSSIAFSPDGKIFASGGRDKVVKLWDAATGKNIATLAEHKSRITDVAFAPDGKSLASASTDRTVKIWPIEGVKKVITLPPHSDQVESVAFSPDGKLLASSCYDSNIRIWDVKTHKLIVELGHHRSSVDSVVFSPDSKLFASSGMDGTIRLWKTSDLPLATRR